VTERWKLCPAPLSDGAGAAGVHCVASLSMVSPASSHSYLSSHGRRKAVARGAARRLQSSAGRPAERVRRWSESDGAHPFQDPGVPSLQAGLALAGALAQNPASAERSQNTSSRRGLANRRFNRDDMAKPVPPSSRTPITGVKIQRVWAEDSNLRRGKPRSKHRFYLVFLLTKLSNIALRRVLGPITSDR